MKKMKLKIKNFLKFYIEFLVQRCFNIFTPGRPFSLFSSQGIQPELRSIYTTQVGFADIRL